jgi:hypothetical protein
MLPANIGLAWLGLAWLGVVHDKVALHHAENARLQSYSTPSLLPVILLVSNKQSSFSSLYLFSCCFYETQEFIPIYYHIQWCQGTHYVLHCITFILFLSTCLELHILRSRAI